MPRRKQILPKKHGNEDDSTDCSAEKVAAENEGPENLVDSLPLIISILIITTCHVYSGADRECRADIPPQRLSTRQDLLKNISSWDTLNFGRATRSIFNLADSSSSHRMAKISIHYTGLMSNSVCKPYSSDTTYRRNSEEFTCECHQSVVDGKWLVLDLRSFWKLAREQTPTNTTDQPDQKSEDNKVFGRLVTD
uniref:Uncharacterized protein n=1 Tax=Romanomermis culicivorax TaxID=13658 RepID=A0A915IPV4_ROMCU